MGWPTSSDLQNYLKAGGLMALDPTATELLLDFSGALNAAVERWNDETRYWPFLSTGTDEARRFLPPTQMLLDLNGGLVALTSLMIDVTYTSSGTAYTSLQHFKLLPRDAPQKRAPWTLIEFTWSPWSVYDGEIEIAGKWGYCLDANLPESAKRGVLAYAASDLAPQIQRGISGGTLKWTEGDVSRQYAALDDSRKDWEALANAAALRYRRARIA